MIGPPPVRNALGYPRLTLPVLRGIYQRWALWHGLIDGWPSPLRHIDVRFMQTPWDLSLSQYPQHTKIRRVAEAIDNAVGIPSPLDPQLRPTADQMSAAFSYCSQIESKAETNSFTRFYSSLVGAKKEAAASASGNKRRRAAAAGLPS